MHKLLAGVFMGWSLGSNDSANIFGTAVYSKMIRFRTAIILCSVFVIIGALIEGQQGMHTLSGLVKQTANSAFIASFAAALTVTMMTCLKLPASTSQAMVGAIIGIGLFIGDVNYSVLNMIVICWIGTPVGTVIVTIILYPFIGKILELLPINIFTRDRILKIGLITAGSYGAYALGANNVANVTGVFTQTGQLSIFQAALLGGASIALGAITYSRNVMKTVGKNLVKLDSFSAFIAVLSSAIVVHIFSKVGVPVSTSQAIIGAVLGIGLLKGAQTINLKTLFSILSGWVCSPIIAAILSYSFFSFFFG